MVEAQGKRQVMDDAYIARQQALLNEKIESAGSFKSQIEKLTEQLQKKKAEIEILLDDLKLKKSVHLGIQAAFVNKSVNEVDIKEYKELVANDDVFLDSVSLSMEKARKNVPEPLHHKFIKFIGYKRELQISLPKATIIAKEDLAGLEL